VAIAAAGTTDEPLPESIAALQTATQSMRIVNTVQGVADGSIDYAPTGAPTSTGSCCRSRDTPVWGWRSRVSVGDDGTERADVETLGKSGHVAPGGRG